MKETTLQRIRDNTANGRTTVIGAYTFKVDYLTGDILRAKTEDIGRMWIDHNGNRTTAWEVVVKA